MPRPSRDIAAISAEARARGIPPDEVTLRQSDRMPASLPMPETVQHILPPEQVAKDLAALEKLRAVPSPPREIPDWQLIALAVLVAAIGGGLITLLGFAVLNSFNPI